MDFLTQLWISLLILSIAEGATINSNQNVPSNLIPCEAGWFLFGDMCYKVWDKKKALTRNGAEVTCALNNASLVTIQSRELQEFLTTFLLLDVKWSVWIGLMDRDRQFNYVWDDNLSVSYTNWNNGPPKRLRDRRGYCAEMNYYVYGTMGAWVDTSCDTTLPFICQQNKKKESLNHDPRLCTAENEGAWKYISSCYHTVDKEMSWDDAENYCQTTLKGHLLSVLDSIEELFLNNVLSNFREEFWMGIKIRGDTQQRWTSGWPLTYKKWEDEHGHEAEGTCAYMTKQKHWSLAPCFRKLPFVCEVPNDKLPVLKQAPNGWRCPQLSEDWIDVGGDTCYIIETSKQKKWHEANFICLKKGGHLASIHSIAETNALHPYVSTYQLMSIGLHRSLLNDSVFEWVDGTSLNYQNWAIWEPNNENEKCVEIRTDSMEWKDADCNDNRGYICSAIKVPPTGLDGNEIGLLKNQHLEETDFSGNASSSTIMAVLFFLVAVLLVAGFTIYKYKDHCRKFNNYNSNHFTLLYASRGQTRSPNFI